jgi:c-di-GMP-related signal transduction protein
MRKLLLASALTLAASLAASLATVAAAAEAEYRTLHMEIDIARPAKDVWAKVGKYCDIAEWLKLDCKLTSGDGGFGTVRALAGGRVLEILIAQTELSYGYTQPVREGQFYNLYHGFMEARPVSRRSSKMIYTLVYDVSNLADAAAKDADVARRRTSFENALKEMKRIAEAK